MLYQVSGTPSHSLGASNDEVQVNTYSSRQFNCPDLLFQNGGNKESETSSILDKNKGVPFQISDYHYCRLPPKITDLLGTLRIK